MYHIYRILSKRFDITGYLSLNAQTNFFKLIKKKGKKKRKTKNKIILAPHEFTCDPVSMMVLPRCSHMNDKADAV